MIFNWYRVLFSFQTFFNEWIWQKREKNHRGFARGGVFEVMSSPHWFPRSIHPFQKIWAVPCSHGHAHTFTYVHYIYIYIYIYMRPDLTAIQQKPHLSLSGQNACMESSARSWKARTSITRILKSHLEAQQLKFFFFSTSPLDVL